MGSSVFYEAKKRNCRSNLEQFQALKNYLRNDSAKIMTEIRTFIVVLNFAQNKLMKLFKNE
jgi:hypothetical protein